MRLAAYFGDVLPARQLAAAAAAVYGGATTTQGRGLWHDDDGKLHDDVATIVEVYATDTPMAREHWHTMAQVALDDSSELSVLVTINHDAELLNRRNR